MQAQIQYEQVFRRGMSYTATAYDIHVKATASGEIEINGRAQKGKSIVLKLERKEAAVLGHLLVAAAEEGVEMQASFDTKKI